MNAFKYRDGHEPIKHVTNVMVHSVESQPGDATKYQYYVAVDYNYYSFMPKPGTTIKYPQTLDYYEVHDMTDEKIVEKAKELKVNPWTLKECIRTVKELWGD